MKETKTNPNLERVFGDALFSGCLLPTTMPAQAKKSSFLMAVLGFPKQREKTTTDELLCSLRVFLCVCVCVFT